MVPATGGSWADDGVYGGEFAEVGGEFDGDAGGECDAVGE